MPGLMVTVGADNEPFRKELKQTQALAAVAGRNIDRGLSGEGGHGGVKSGAIRELLVLTREISAGNWTKVPGSFSILLQQIGVLKFAFKDTALAAETLAAAESAMASKAAIVAEASVAKAAASLYAAEANGFEDAALIAAADADEIKAAADLQVAHASIIKSNASTAAAIAAREEAGASKISLGVLGYAVIALAAFAAAAYFSYQHFSKLREGVRHFNDLLDLSNVKYSDQVDALKKSSEAAQEYHDWLKKLGDKQESLADKTSETIKMMEEESKLRRHQAEEKGANKGQLAAMEIKDQQAQLGVLIAAQKKAKENLAKDKRETGVAESLANDPNRLGKIAKAKESQDAAKELYEAVLKKQQSPNFMRGLKAGLFGKLNNDQLLEQKVDVEVGGKTYKVSVNQARAALDRVTAAQIQLENVQKQLASLYARKKTLTEKDVSDVSKLEKEARDLKGKIALEQKYPETGKNKLQLGHLTSLQQVGAYTAPGAIALLDVNRKTERNTAKTAAALEKIMNAPDSKWTPFDGNRHF